MGTNPVINELADVMYKGKKPALLDPLTNRPEGELKKTDAGHLL